MNKSRRTSVFHLIVDFGGTMLRRWILPCYLRFPKKTSRRCWIISRFKRTCFGWCWKVPKKLDKWNKLWQKARYHQKNKSKYVTTNQYTCGFSECNMAEDASFTLKQFHPLPITTISGRFALSNVWTKLQLNKWLRFATLKGGKNKTLYSYQMVVKHGDLLWLEVWLNNKQKMKGLVNQMIFWLQPLDFQFSSW